MRPQLTLFLASSLACFSACELDTSARPGDYTSAAEVVVTNAPSDGSCLRITIDGARRDVRSFDLTAGRDTNFTLSNLPIGELRIWADAYPFSCVKAIAGTQASSFSETVTSKAKPGALLHVTLPLLRNGQPNVSVADDKKASRPAQTSRAGVPPT